jgi:hypothetical protein
MTPCERFKLTDYPSRPSLDRGWGGRYGWQNGHGDFCVKPVRCILALLLLATVVCAATLPVADDPSTAFNESDSPANMALPVMPAVKLVRRATDPVPAPEPMRQVTADISLSAYTPRPVPKQQRSHSLLRLLCTLLI